MIKIIRKFLIRCLGGNDNGKDITSDKCLGEVSCPALGQYIELEPYLFVNVNQAKSYFKEKSCSFWLFLDAKIAHVQKSLWTHARLV